MKSFALLLTFLSTHVMGLEPPSQTEIDLGPFGPFPNFTPVKREIVCERKPGTDYILCEYFSSKNPKSLNQKYFEKQNNAFPDITNDFWFFLDEFENPESSDRYGSPNHMHSVDMDNDGDQELLQVFFKGPGHDIMRGQYVSENAKTHLIVWDFDGEKFYDATDKFLNDVTNMACIPDWKSINVDLNQDSIDDIFFSCSQEDGRNPNLGSDMQDFLVGLLSQSNGKYDIVKFGPKKWYHSVGSGIDDNGIPFVTGAGYPNNHIQNNVYYFDNYSNDIFTNYSNTFPNISPASFVFLSKNSDSSDTLIQHSFDEENAVQGYYRKNTYSEWIKTPLVSVESKFEDNVIIQLFSGDERQIPITKINEKFVAGIGGGGGFKDFCELRLFKDSSSLAAATLELSWLPDFKSGDIHVSDSEIVPISITYLINIVNGEIVIKPAEIIGEENFISGSTPLSCMDVNNDGYDDLVYSISYRPEWVKRNSDRLKELDVEYPTHQRIYINQQNGKFKKLNLDSSDNFEFPENYGAEAYGSIMADVDGDKIQDIVVFPHNVVTFYKSMDGTMMLYKGKRSLSLDKK